MSEIVTCVPGPVVVLTISVTNGAGTSQSRKMGIVKAVLKAGCRQRLFRKSGLAAKRQFSDINESFNLLRLENRKKIAIAQAFVADSE